MEHEALMRAGERLDDLQRSGLRILQREDPLLLLLEEETLLEEMRSGR